MSEPIRVLCVFSTLDRGGAESMCMNLYRNMDRDKVQFDFVKHTTAKCAFDDEILSLGGRIYVAPRFRGYNLREYESWWKKQLETHPEHQIIHGHFFTIAGVYFTVAHQMGRVTIGHSHSAQPLNEKTNLKSISKVLLKRWIERESDYCLACSKDAGKWLFPNKKFDVLKNAIDTASFKYDVAIRKQMRENLSLQEDAKLVGVVGSFTEVKNPFFTLSVFEELHKLFPNTRLLWCGGGPLFSKVQDTVFEKGLQGTVILPGIRNDVNNLLQAMDVFIMPSLFEGLGLAAIEAQGAGLPCILSDTMPREVKVLDNCCFCKLDNLDEWVYAIRRGFEQERTDASSIISAAGYDIHETSRWLQNYYLRITDNMNQRF